MNDQDNNIKAVIFDLGRVLVAIDNSYLVKHLFKGLNIDDLQQLGQKTMSDPAMVEFNSGRMSAEEFHQCMCSTYNLQLDFENFCQTWVGIFYTMEGMESLVTSLTNRVSIGLLSDTDPVHWGHIRTTWPWIGAIEKPTLSYEVGVMKPNAQIYLAAAANVNTEPRECLYVDDLQANVDGARQVGMKAVRFENVEQLENVLNDFGLMQ